MTWELEAPEIVAQYHWYIVDLVFMYIQLQYLDIAHHMNTAAITLY